MKSDDIVVEEVAGLYRVLQMKVLRRTPGVAFDMVPGTAFRHASCLDRVMHTGGAISPGPVGDVSRPWYMHPYQDDNLLVLHGTRYVDIYTPGHGRIESFAVTSDKVEKDGRLLCDGPAMLVWPRNVFHRIRSCEKEGSASLNIAIHYPDFNIRDNFNVYDLDTETGEYKVIREGHLDQPGG